MLSEPTCSLRLNKAISITFEFLVFKQQKLVDTITQCNLLVARPKRICSTDSNLTTKLLQKKKKKKPNYHQVLLNPYMH